MHGGLASPSWTTRRQKSRHDTLGLGSTDDNAETFRQAAKLATWEGEGGTTVPVE